MEAEKHCLLFLWGPCARELERGSYAQENRKGDHAPGKFKKGIIRPRKSKKGLFRNTAHETWNISDPCAKSISSTPERLRIVPENHGKAAALSQWALYQRYHQGARWKFCTYSDPKSRIMCSQKKNSYIIRVCSRLWTEQALFFSPCRIGAVPILLTWYNLHRLRLSVMNSAAWIAVQSA